MFFATKRARPKMLHDLRKATPWLAIFVLSLMVGIGAARAARHCLLDRQSTIRVGVIHRVGPPFWGLSCGRADPVSPLSPVSLRPASF
jgi:hypothetical protein